MIAKILSRLCVLVFVLFFAQLPVFVEQYLLRLEGHLAESNRHIAAFQESASISKKTLNEYIAKFLVQEDADFKSQGNIMQAAVERNQFLSTSRDALRSANPLFRPALFARYIDTSIAHDAWKTFAVGLSLSLDVGVWALIGLIFGWLIVMAFKGLFTRKQKEHPLPEKK